MKRLALLLLALVPSVAPGGESKGATVRFSSPDEVELHGTFHAGTRRSPAVLLLHDVGSKHRAKDWGRLPEYLHEKGYAVLTFDFRGHGRSTTVEPTSFWSTRFGANRAYVKGGIDDDIDVKHFDFRYYPVLANDVAAAKAFLDRKNDQGECDSSNLILIGAEEGATVAALWLNAEWHRYRLMPSPFFGAAPQLAPNPEGVSVLCAVWLSIRPQLGDRSVSLTSLLDLAGRQKQVPMVFLHGPEEARGKATALALERHLRGRQKLTFTAAVEMPGTGKASGTDLLDNEQADKAIADYLEGVRADREREWAEHDPEDAQYVWRLPRGGLQAANAPGSNVPSYRTYYSFLPAR